MTDYIERDKAIKAVCGKCTACSVVDDKKDKAFYKAYCAEIRALQKIPAADVKPVIRGYNKNHDYSSLFKCSVCGWECRDTLSGDTTDYNFCPYCGADMRETDETTL